MANQTTYICKPDATAEANEGSIYAMILDDKAKLGHYKGYMIRRRKKFGEEVLDDIFVLPEDFRKYYAPASIIDMSLLHEDAFLDEDIAAVESLIPVAPTVSTFEVPERTVSGVGTSRSQMDDDELEALEALLRKI